MKTVLEQATREELISRIHKLQPGQPALWGKMNVFQMVRHGILCDDFLLGKIKVKRVFIGRIIGRALLKKVLKDDKPFRRNTPTAPVLITLDYTGDFEADKQAWIEQVREYTNYANHSFVHPFFGPMTKEQVGLFAYKHADHHLRQFGV
jgi:hypothetical protein